MKLQFIGRGGAFAPISIGNSNMILTSDSGKMMLIDFGTTAPYIMRDEMNIDFREVDSVYITHQHADHVGGLEMFAFSRYFMPKMENDVFVKPKLYCIKSLMKELWDNTLKGGLESLQGKIMTLTDYFDCKPVMENKSFDWEGYRFYPIQTVHVRSGYIIKNSYGLAIYKILHDSNGKCYTVKSDAVYITSDTQFDMGLMEFYKNSRMIFHDCETTPFKSNVHPNYADLKTLPNDIKKKMWLYHYGQQIDTFEQDGFAGFVEKGQIFEL